MNERRYSDTEVAEIFQRATEAQQQGGRIPLASGDGMTLSAIQEIGREVGLPPELVARAAKSLERGGRPFTRRFVGLPIGVGRTVELERRLTNTEWERLVVDLRETFDARGSVRQDGGLRQWTNGNLQALVEPGATGDRLRLKTTNGAATAWMTGGAALVGVAAVSLIAAVTGDVPMNTEIWSRFLSMAGLGTGLFSVGALRLPSWARLRRRQMEEISARAAAIATEPPVDS